MFVSGLSFIRNGVRLGYPFVEAIKSALPLCDEFIVVVGQSDDGTREQIEAIGDPRIKIVDTVWSPKTEPQQAVLAQQTNAGLMQCQGDWVVYVQGNEVFHEKDLGHLRSLMQQNLENSEVEGLVVERMTFFGDYNNCYSVYPGRYKYTVRIFKPWRGVYSVKDAMTFAIFDNYGRKGRDLKCLDTGVDIYRYGLVVSPEAMTAKFNEAPHVAGLERGGFVFSAFYENPKSFFVPFRGIHPDVMRSKIENHELLLDRDSPQWRDKLTMKEWLRIIESWIYSRLGMPKFRVKRASIIGKLVRKDRRGGY